MRMSSLFGFYDKDFDSCFSKAVAVPRGLRGRGPSEISAPPVGPKKVQDNAATCQNFLHYILTNEFACVYVFII